MKRIIVKKYKSGCGYRYDLLCNNCGKQFSKNNSYLKQNKCLFCSTKCSNSFLDKIKKDNQSKLRRKKKLGCLFDKTARQNMSEGQKKRYKNPIERKKLSERAKKWIKEKGHPKGMLGKIAWNKGKESKRWKGKNNPNWNNGSSFEEYGKEFDTRLKEKIRKRDNLICQNCGGKQLKRKLDIHHIDYNKKNNNENNLISLCHKCHMQTNHRRKYWQQYFNKV